MLYNNNLNIIIGVSPKNRTELNPPERVWREFKDSMAWKNFTTIPELQIHISKIIESLSLQNIMSLTQYSYIIDAFHKLNKK